MEHLPFTKPFIDEQTITEVSEVLRSGWLATGPKLALFEKTLSDYVGGRPVKAFTSATGALEVALQAMGIGPGDEVITPAMSFAASPNVIMRVGARPVFTDVDLKSKNIRVSDIESKITKRTKAILPVHFAGLPVEMDELYALAKKHHLRVLEDAAHAIGSSFKNKRIGSFGDVVSFSFHPNKNITSIEGGALTFNGSEELRKIDLFRFHGLDRDAFGNMEVEIPGGKYNMPDVCAAVGLGQLRHLDEFCSKRRELAYLYFNHLADVPGLVLPERGDEGHSWHIFAPLLPLGQMKMDRAGFIKEMAARKIGIGVHYPALHLFKAYRALGYKDGDFVNAERIGRETVTLPLFPAMTAANIERVCGAIKEVLGL